MNAPGAIYNEDYFINGKAKGLSNYENYRFLPEVCLPCVHRITEYLGARHGDLILDYGSGPGTYVKAYRMLGFESFGYDISEWAVKNCHPDVQRFMSTDFPKFYPDWVVAKDSLEHVPENQLFSDLERLNRQTSKGLLIIVPLTAELGGQYLREEDEVDVTHVIRWTLLQWMDALEKKFPKFTLSASYRVPGIKKACEEVPHSTGFFKLTR